MKRRLLGNVASLVMVQFANYVLPFLTLVYLTDTIGLELYGILAYAQGIITLSILFIDFGYDLSATNRISKNRHRKKYIGKLMGGIFAVKIILFLICFIAIFLYYYFDKKYINYNNIFLLSLFPIAVQSFTPLWFYHGTERLKYFAAISIASKLIIFIFY